MIEKRIHFAGTDHRVPDRGSKGYHRVAARGCSCSERHDGEFDCDHGYTWSCDDCPVNDFERLGAVEQDA